MKMNKKAQIGLLKNKYVLAAVVILAVYFLYGGGFLGATLGKPPVYADSGNTYYHYASNTVHSEFPSVPKNQFSNERTIETDKSKFTFKVYEIERLVGSYRGAPNNPTRKRPITAVTYRVEIFKDGKQIDTLEKYDASNIDYFTNIKHLDQRYYRAYSDSGQVYKSTLKEPRLEEPSTYDKHSLPSGESGINVVFGFDNYFHSEEGHAYVINKYEVINIEKDEVIEEEDEVIDDDEIIDDEIIEVKARNIFTGIINWFKELWQKITG